MSSDGKPCVVRGELVPRSIRVTVTVTDADGEGIVYRYKLDPAHFESRLL